jgi:hypothetical protein
MSRRSLLRGAAGAGAVGIAAAAGAGAVLTATRPAAAQPAAAGNTVKLDAVTQSDEPLVAYLRDTKSGEFEIYHGSNVVKVHNPGLVAELLRGLQTAL